MDPTAFATAYSLATSVGIRPFLTLAPASLAMHFGYLHPSHAAAALALAITVLVFTVAHRFFRDARARAAAAATPS